MKIILKIVLATLFLLVVAVAALLVFFDPNDHKDRIVDLIEANTGRDARIDGDIGWSIFPTIGIEAQGFVLGNLPGFDDAPIIHVDSVDFGAELLPLLRGELRVSKIFLTGAKINLEVLADGAFNWKGLGKDRKEIDKVAEETFARDEPEKQAFSMMVETIVIRDSSIRYRDAQSNQDLTFALHALETKNIGFDGTFPLSLDAAFASEQLGNYQFKVVGDVTLNHDASRIEVPNLQLSVTLNDLNNQTVTLNTDLLIDQTAQQIALNQFSLAGPAELRLTGELQAANYTADLLLDGNLTVHPVNPTRLGSSFGVDLGMGPQSKVLRALTGNLSLKTEGKLLKIAPLQFTLDDMTISGSAALPMADGLPIGFDLSVNQLNLDNFMPAESAGAASTNSQATDERELNASLRGLHLDGQLKIGSIQVAGLGMQSFSTSIKAAGGKIRLQPNAQLYSGNYSGNIALDATGNQLSWSANETLRGIQIGPLLKDLVDVDRVTGTGNLSLKLTGSGLTTERIYPSLNGSTEFSFTNGVVRGINLKRVLRDAKAALGKGTPSPQEENKTDFAELTGTAQIVNGVVTNRDLLAKAPYLRVSGDGSLDLPKGSVDYVVIVKVVGTDVGEGGKDFQDLEGLSIPVRVRGPFDSLSYSLDIDALLKERANQELEKQKAKVQEKIDAKKDELQDKVQDKLKEGLLRGLRF